MPAKIVKEIREYLKQSIENEKKVPTPPGSFRSSKIGGCPREIYLEMTGHEPAPKSPELEMVFRDGHLHESQLMEIISHIHNVTNRQHPVWKKYKATYKGEEFEFMVTATTDGIINAEEVIDVKSMSTFGYKYLGRQRMLEYYKKYVEQIQFYLDIYEKETGVILIKNKDNGGLRAYYYKRDPQMLEISLKRLAGILWAIKHNVKVKIPKGYVKSKYPCKGCFMRVHCWGVPPEKRKW